MERRIPREKRKYLKYDSERSGFTYFKRELVKETEDASRGMWVHPEEKDEPAPYNRYIGGEGDSNVGEIRSRRKDYPTAKTEIWSP
jgi:hypothetical protein